MIAIKGDWKQMYTEQIDKVGGNLIFDSNIKANDINATGVRSIFSSKI